MRTPINETILYSLTQQEKKRLSFAQRSHFPSQVSHRGPPNLPETAVGRPHQVFLQSSPGQIKALVLFFVFYTDATGTLRAAADSQRGPQYDSSSAGKRPEPSVLPFDVRRRVSFRRPPKNCLHHHIPPATKNAALLWKPHDQLPRPCGKVFFKARALMNQTASMRG